MNKILNIKFSTFFLIILIFIPKINIIEIKGFYQGIRLEDILITIYTLYLFKSYSSPKIVVWGKFFQFKYWIVILYLFSVSIFFALINNIESRFIFILRAAEYGILIIYFNNYTEKLSTYINIFKCYIIINFILSCLQNYGLVGSFSSLGYLNTDHFLNTRTYGLSGGSWEIGVLINFSFIILLNFLKNKNEILIYYLLSAIILILAYGRANLLAFFVISIYLFFFKKEFLKFKIMIIFSLAISILCILLIYYLNAENSDYLKYLINYCNKVMKDIIFIINGTYELITNNFAPETSQATSDSVYSFIYRLQHWKEIYSIFQTNDHHYFIGAGSPKIYTESLLVRIITSLGLLGMLIIVCGLRNLSIFYISVFFVMGISLDLFISMKIFIFAILMLKINSINKDRLWI
jgi:hypothetical protein